MGRVPLLSNRPTTVVHPLRGHSVSLIVGIKGPGGSWFGELGSSLMPYASYDNILFDVTP
jgi:hypothetical protein